MCSVVRRATAADAAEITRLRRIMFASMGLDCDAVAWEPACVAFFEAHLRATRTSVAIVVDAPDGQDLAASGVIEFSRPIPSPHAPPARPATSAPSPPTPGGVGGAWPPPSWRRCSAVARTRRRQRRPPRHRRGSPAVRTTRLRRPRRQPGAAPAPRSTTRARPSHHTDVVSTISYGDDVPDDAELRLCGDVAGKRVIELGIGPAPTPSRSPRGRKAIAVDPSAERIAVARRRGRAAEVRVEFHQGDLADLGFATSGSVDVVVLRRGTLGRVDDLPRVFRQVHRVLKPGAPFVFSVPHPIAAMLEGGEVVLRKPYWRTAARSERPVHGARAHQLPSRRDPRAGARRTRTSWCPPPSSCGPASSASDAAVRRPGRPTATAARPTRRRGGVGLVAPSGPSVEADLQQERQRLTDHRPRRDAEMLHHGVPVELGTDRRSSSSSASSAMRSSSSSMRRASCAALRSLRVVQSQRVSTISSSSSRRRRGRSGAPPSRSSPSGRCGSAGAARPARSPRRRRRCE